MTRSPIRNSCLDGLFCWNIRVVQWLMITIIVYYMLPYDIDGAFQLSLKWLWQRFCIQFCIMIACNLSVRNDGQSRESDSTGASFPHSRRILDTIRMVTNALHGAAWEAAYVHCLARGRLRYDTTAGVLNSPIIDRTFPLTPTLLASPANVPLLRLIAAIALVPVWCRVHALIVNLVIRNIHRLVHRAHRSLQGTAHVPPCTRTAHPVEMMYAYSCVAPAVLLSVHPFVFWWIVVLLARSTTGGRPRDCPLLPRVDVGGDPSPSARKASTTAAPTGAAVPPPVDAGAARPNPAPTAARAAFTMVALATAVLVATAASGPVGRPVRPMRGRAAWVAADDDDGSHGAPADGSRRYPSVPPFVGRALADSAAESAWNGAAATVAALGPEAFALVAVAAPLVAASAILGVADRTAATTGARGAAPALRGAVHIGMVLVVCAPLVALVSVAGGGAPIMVPMWGGDAVPFLPLA